MKKSISIIASIILLTACNNNQQNMENQSIKQELNFTQEWDKTFALSEQVEHKKVTFKNRYGITLVGDLYTPKGATGKLPALVLSGPFGAVKEQSSGLHAHEMAKRGFITLAFDGSFTGESGGAVRDVASPEIFTEDFSAAVDYIGLLPNVDREKIGVLAVCGLTGMGITAATGDSRIKAVATTAMYDMSRSMTKGYQDSYTKEQRAKAVDHISQQRWKDAESGTYARGWHELGFDENNNVVSDTTLFRETVSDDAPEFVKRYFDYYTKGKRGFHPRSLNSVGAWTATTPMAFFQFNLMDNLEHYDRPLLLVTGDKAHSRYYSETVYEKSVSPKKEIVIVEDADHLDLYDNIEKIPFDKFESFFKESFK